MSNSKKPIVITKSQDDGDYTLKREPAQKLNFAKIQEVLERNVTKSVNKTFTQYTKELIKTYVQSPNANQDTIREISRFLCRNSMIYQKLIMYYASMPLFHYNIVQFNDFSKDISTDKALKNYETLLKRFSKFNLAKEGYTALYIAIRDGVYVGYTYDSEEDGIFCMPLDVKYCRIYGKTAEGEWIVYFNAAYFDSGNNGDYISGDSDGNGIWDTVFVDGYNTYKNQGRDYQWFRLPPEKTMCIISGSEDEFTYPMPYFLPLFVSLLDLLDLEQIIQSKTELENYKLIVSKIPLIQNSDDVDDFSISLELAKAFNDLLANSVPEQVGVVYSPMDIDTVNFENSNTTKDTDALALSIQNLFNNAGASQLVVAGGASTSVTSLKHALQNDMSTAWIWVNRLQSWLNYFIKTNIAEGCELIIHKITWYNRDEYISEAKDSATLGGSALDYLTAKGDSPYIAIQKLKFENAIGIKNLMIPLQTSYTQTADSSSVGAPTKNEDDLSSEGAKSQEKRARNE